MLSVYLCEDEEQELRYLKKTITNIITIEDLDMKLVAACASPDALLAAVNAGPIPALYFLDIDLKSSINGLELAVELRRRDPRGFIVFITSKGELAPLAFRYKVEALDYICKDDREVLPERVYHCICTALERYASSQNDIHNTLKIKMQGSYFIYPKQEIYYIETAATPHKIRLHTAHKISEISTSLSDIETQLGNDFIRIHKSYIANKRHIFKIDKHDCLVYFDNGSCCPCSTRFARKASL